MLFVIVLVIIGLIVYFAILKKSKCDICGKEYSAVDIQKIGDKCCCSDCLTKKKATGLIRYRQETYGKDISDINTINEYEKYINDLYNDSSLIAGKGSVTNKFIMATGMLLTPTIIVSSRYDNVAFRTKEIIAITMEEDVWQKVLIKGYKGYIVTLFTKNKFIPFLHTCVVGRDKFFKFSSTQEKERRNALAEGFNAMFGTGFFKIDIPYNNYDGLKKYIKENEEDLKKKGILNDEFTKAIFIENIKNASVTNFKELFANHPDGVTKTEMNACDILSKFKYTESITLNEI